MEMKVGNDSTSRAYRRYENLRLILFNHVKKGTPLPASHTVFTLIKKINKLKEDYHQKLERLKEGRVQPESKQPYEHEWEEPPPPANKKPATTELTTWQNKDERKEPPADKKAIETAKQFENLLRELHLQRIQDKLGDIDYWNDPRTSARMRELHLQRVQDKLGGIDYWNDPRTGDERERDAKSGIDYWNDPRTSARMRELHLQRVQDKLGGIDYWNDPRTGDERQRDAKSGIDYWNDPRQRDAKQAPIDTGFSKKTQYENLMRKFDEFYSQKGSGSSSARGVRKKKRKTLRLRKAKEWLTVR